MRRLPHRAGAPTAALLLLVLLATGCEGTAGPGSIDIGIRYSRYTPDAIRVAAGQTVTFTIRNDDPIAHEFILGTAAEQAKHEAGSEENHDGTPGAASLEPGETEVVAYRFGERGTLEFACHLPGHFAYGMRGVVTIG